MTKLTSLLVVTPFSKESLGLIPGGVTAVSTQIGTNNLATFYPLVLPSPTKFMKACVVNGATAAGNIDIGIYDSNFNLIVSHGGAAQTGTATMQEFDITDTWFDAGDYWMAVAGSNTSGTIYGCSLSDEIGAVTFPVMEATTSYPLPSSVTPTKSAKSAPPVYCIGFSTDGLG